MDSLVLGVIKWYWQGLAVFFVIVSILLIILVLLQKGKGGGLSAAFGGAGGQSAFGSKTGDVFTWITIVIVGSFLLLAMVLTVNYKPDIVLDAIPSSLVSPDTPGDSTTEALPDSDSAEKESSKEADKPDSDSVPAAKPQSTPTPDEQDGQPEGK